MVYFCYCSFQSCFRDYESNGEFSNIVLELHAINYDDILRKLAIFMLAWAEFLLAKNGI
jgi:hypothetical protein